METYTPKITIKVNEIFNQGWTLTKKHFPIFLLMYILTQSVANLPNYAYYGSYFNSIMTHGAVFTEEEWIQMLIQEGRHWGQIGQISILGLLGFLLTCHLNITTFRMLHAAVKGEKVDMTAELKNAFHCFWFYTGAYVVYLIIIVAGCCCFLLPGIYLGIRYMFVPIIAANHPEISFSETFSRSWQMTKGHFGKLLWLGIVVCGINILGFLCCCVGLLFTLILSNMMLISVYQLLYPSTPITDHPVD